MEDYDDGDSSEQTKQVKKGNVLPLWGNERSMNLNPLILTNIQSSHYFKVNLYELKTYHEVIDEIYYKVSHLEPWEKGSRKTAGQTGMCGGVRGVGAGGIVSTAYCLLYKLFTLRLTRKQLNGLINHADSPYIRALGFMYIRYTQPPADLFDWYDEYLEDPEEMDVKAGGGQVLTMGDLLRAFLTKLEWFSTLFPRIPVPIQQKIEKRLNERFPPQAQVRQQPQQQLQQQQQQQQRFRNVEQNVDRSGSRGNDHFLDRLSGQNRDSLRERRPPSRERGDSYRDRSPVRERERSRHEYRERDDSRHERHERDRERGKHREHRHRDEKKRRHHHHHHHAR